MFAMLKQANLETRVVRGNYSKEQSPHSERLYGFVCF